MKIKHSKFKNTGLIYELLVKQIAADTLSKNESAAVSILKKYFGGNTVIAKELKLYEYILKNNNLSEAKAETVISSITEISRKLNQKSLKDFKYKFTILEHLTTTDIDKNSVKDTLIEEYSKYDKDLRLLTYKILLEKFNNNYQTLLPEQKNILKEFITSVNSKTRLRTLVNEEVEKIRTEVKKLASNVKDEVIKIKLQEVLKSIKTLKKTEKISDNHLINLMQYYDLVNEMRKL